MPRRSRLLTITPSTHPLTTHERNRCHPHDDAWQAWGVRFTCDQCGRRAAEEIVGERAVVANYYHPPICETCRTGELP